MTTHETKQDNYLVNLSIALYELLYKLEQKKVLTQAEYNTLFNAVPRPDSLAV